MKFGKLTILKNWEARGETDIVNFMIGKYLSECKNNTFELNLFLCI